MTSPCDRPGQPCSYIYCRLQECRQKRPPPLVVFVQLGERFCKLPFVYYSPHPVMVNAPQRCRARKLSNRTSTDLCNRRCLGIRTAGTVHKQRSVRNEGYAR